MEHIKQASIDQAPQSKRISRHSPNRILGNQGMLQMMDRGEMKSPVIQRQIVVKDAPENNAETLLERLDVLNA